MPIVTVITNPVTQTLGATSVVGTVTLIETDTVQKSSSAAELEPAEFTGSSPAQSTESSPAQSTGLPESQVTIDGQSTASQITKDTPPITATPPISTAVNTAQTPSAVPSGVRLITIVSVYTYKPLTTYNASLYSHSTVFMTTEQDPSAFAFLRAPPLTTVFTPNEDCSNRWMLAGTGQEIIRYAPSEASPTIVTPNESALSSSFAGHDHTLFSMNINGTATDSAYRTCNPYGLQNPTYSPGICPYGQTVAEVTAYQASASSGYHTFWQASCCKSGFTFGPEYAAACISTISSPVQAYALITSTAPNGGAASTFYQDGSQSSTTTLSTGLAIADPIVVAWQTQDYSLFPSGYVASLGKRYDLAVATGTPSPALSTGAKAGIGVGVACGAIVLVGGFVFWLLKRRHKTKHQQQIRQEHPIAEMADQDHDHARRKWWVGGKWRHEAGTHADPQELDHKTVHVVQGPPAELEGAELQHPNEAGRAVYPQRDASNL